MTDEASSPSFNRRQVLRQSAGSASVNASRPLQDYFSLAQRLRLAFGQALDARQVDAAYVYGLRLAHLMLEALPQHPHWKHTTHAKQKRKLTAMVDQTIAQMEVLKQRMDAEELQKQQEAARLIKQQEQLAQERQWLEQQQAQKRVEAQQRLEQERQQVLEQYRQEQQQQEASQKKQAIQQSALEKLQALQTQMNHSPENKSNAPQPVSKPTSPRASQHHQDATGKSAMEKLHALQAHSNQAMHDSHPNDATTVQPTPNLPSTPIPDSTTATVSPQMQRTTTPRSAKEQATIHSLERAIKAQETKMEQIESKQVPQLVNMAKEHLRLFRATDNTTTPTKTKKENQDKANPHRRAALHCLARKKKLERQVEVSKSAIFQMETQIFMLENAMEDRQVHQTLGEASLAMASLQQQDATTTLKDACASFADDLAASLSSENSTLLDYEEDEEELLEELEQLLSSSQGGSKIANEAWTGDEADMLSLPPTLSTPLPKLSKNPASDSTEASSETSSVRNWMKAVLG